MSFNYTDEIKEEYPDTVVEAIERYMRPPMLPITIKYIKQKVHKEWELNYSDWKVARFVKQRLKYSYKKGCSRPPKVGGSKNIVAKGWFAVELLIVIHSRKIVINVDESSFERSVKQNYSWLPRGSSGIILNDVFKRKSSLILATASNLLWFAMIKEVTVSSLEFCLFIKLLVKVLTPIMEQSEVLPLLILDNARVHNSKLASRVMQNWNFEVNFLPPYWPELAPVELIFGAVKAKLKSLKLTEEVDFSKVSGKTLILKLINSLSDSTWHGVWTTVIKECSHAIRDARLEKGSSWSLDE